MKNESINSHGFHRDGHQPNSVGVPVIQGGIFPIPLYKEVDRPNSYDFMARKTLPKRQPSGCEVAPCTFTMVNGKYGIPEFSPSLSGLLHDLEPNRQLLLAGPTPNAKIQSYLIVCFLNTHENYSHPT